MRTIDADALKNYMAEKYVMYDHTFDDIDAQPTIEPKHGKWMPHPTEPDWDVCSVCGTGTMRRTHGYHNGAFWDAEESYSYCPWCGARMEIRGENED